MKIEKYETPPPVPHSTNWVVYPNLLIGGSPNNWDGNDLDALVHGEGLDPGRDIIVSEYSLFANGAALNM